MASAKGKRHLAYVPDLLSCVCTTCERGVKERGGFLGAVDEAAPAVRSVQPPGRQQLVLESSQLLSGLG